MCHCLTNFCCSLTTFQTTLAYFKQVELASDLPLFSCSASVLPAQTVLAVQCTLMWHPSPLFSHLFIFPRWPRRLEWQLQLEVGLLFSCVALDRSHPPIRPPGFPLATGLRALQKKTPRSSGRGCASVQSMQVKVNLRRSVLLLNGERQLVLTPQLQTKKKTTQNNSRHFVNVAHFYIDCGIRMNSETDDTVKGRGCDSHKDQHPPSVNRRASTPP